ncbi:MAG TPA: DUF58 domain-containing protein [Acidobacteriota bacterium]|nr:DUF58 domain-containing protein [Acidobacteriota bacterium]
MKPEEIRQHIRKLKLTARRLIHAFSEGSFRTLFHGRGIEFATLREYVPGDDIRQIEWNTTARRGAPYVKTFVEERDLSVMLMIDLSSSMDIKWETVVGVTTILTTLADLHDDRIGCLGFTQKIEFFLPPRKNPLQQERILHLLLTSVKGVRKTSLTQALAFLRRVMKKHSILFIISDFLDRGFERNLSALAQKHELVGLYVHDPMEARLPEKAVLSSYDPESGKRALFDGYDSKTRSAYRAFFEQQKQMLLKCFARAKADLLLLPAAEGAELRLVEFLRRRQVSRVPLQFVSTEAEH